MIQTQKSFPWLRRSDDSLTASINRKLERAQTSMCSLDAPEALETCRAAFDKARKIQGADQRARSIRDVFSYASWINERFEEQKTNRAEVMPKDEARLQRQQAALVILEKSGSKDKNVLAEIKTAKTAVKDAEESLQNHATNKKRLEGMLPISASLKSAIEAFALKKDITLPADYSAHIRQSRLGAPIDTAAYRLPSRAA